MKENKLKRLKSIEILRFLALPIYQGKNYEVSPSDVLAFPFDDLKQANTLNKLKYCVHWVFHINFPSFYDSSKCWSILM